MSTLAARLSEARRRVDLTQVDVATRLGVSQGTVSDYERGDTVPQLPRLTELADLYGVSLDWLAGREVA